MAVIHPEDRFAARDSKTRELHPAVGLLIGFGFIIAVSATVHVLFGLV